MPRTYETAVSQEFKNIEQLFAALSETANENAEVINQIKADYKVFADTAEFKSVKENLEKLVKVTEQFYKLGFDGKYKQVDDKGKKELLKSYADLNLAISNMAQLMKQDEFRNKLSAESKLPEKINAILEKTQGLVIKDIATLNTAKVPFELPKMIVATRTRDVVLEGEIAPGDFVGANTSARIPITFTDENGVEHKGFFTKDEKVNYKPVLEQIIRSICENMDILLKKQGYPDAVCPNSIKAYFYGILTDLLYNESAFDSPEKCLEFFYSRVNEEGKLKVSKLLDMIIQNNKLPSYLNKKLWKINLTEKTYKTATPEQKQLFNDMQEMFLKKSPKFNLVAFTDDICTLFVQQVHSVGVEEFARGRIQEYFRCNNTSIAQRNSAMSAVAELLGVGHLLAHSENIKLKIGGAEISGVFMENAEGEDIEKVKPGSPLLVAKKYQDVNYLFTAKAKKDIYGLQVLDYLCNNVDRHIGNMLYKMSRDKQHIAGFVGIDNDISFGTHVRKTDLKQAMDKEIALNNLIYIPKDLAEAVFALEPNVLLTVLQGFDLAPDERNAVVERLNMLKDDIVHNKIIVFEDSKINKVDLNFAYNQTRQGVAGPNIPYSLSEALVALPYNVHVVDEKNQKPINFKKATLNQDNFENYVIKPMIFDDLRIQQLKIMKNNMASLDRVNDSMTLMASEGIVKDKKFLELQQDLATFAELSREVVNSLEASYMNVPFAYIDEYEKQLKALKEKTDLFMQVVQGENPENHDIPYTKLQAEALSIFCNERVTELDAVMTQKAGKIYDKHNKLSMEDVDAKLGEIDKKMASAQGITKQDYTRWLVLGELKILGEERLDFSDYDMESCIQDSERIIIDDDAFNLASTMIQVYQDEHHNLNMKHCTVAYNYCMNNVLNEVNRVDALNNEELLKVYLTYKDKYGDRLELNSKTNPYGKDFKTFMEDIRTAKLYCFIEDKLLANQVDIDKAYKEHLSEKLEKKGFEIMEKEDFEPVKTENAVDIAGPIHH